MKKAIIFGITGQDGGHLADLLLSKGYHVVGISRRTSTNNTERIKHVLGNEHFELVQGDITDTHSVIGILKQNDDVDEVYNLAAQSHVAVSFSQPALTWDITGKGCLNLLQSMVDLGINARFYQASSSEMFGKNYDEKIDEDGLNEWDGGQIPLKKYQDENTKFMPQSPYAIAKCAAHYMTRLYREAYGLHASAGILFNHEGPRRGEDFVTRKITKWIGDFVKWKSGEFYTIGSIDIPDDLIDLGRPVDKNKRRYFPKLRLGNLESSRDWGYAGDYVEAMWMMLQQEKPDDYVICTGETHTIREFLDLAFGHVGISDWEKLVVQDPEFYRPAEVDYLRGDNSKALDKLGWKPKCDFAKLVKLMVESDVR